MIYNARFTDGEFERNEVDSINESASRDEAAHNCAEWLMLDSYKDEDGNDPEDADECSADLTGGPTEWSGTVAFRGFVRSVIVKTADA